MFGKVIRCAAMAALLAFPSNAQDATEAPDAPALATASTCELHIWPSAGLRSVFHGWVRGGIVDGTVNGRDGYPEIPKDPMNIAKQTELIRQSPVATVLQLPDHKMVIHETPLESRVARSTVGRIAAESAPCYAELVLDDVFLQQDSFSGSHLKTFFRFRRFGEGDTVTRSFGAFTQSNMKLFPPKEEKGNEAALKDLHAAFTSNIEQFGEFLNKPDKKKKNKAK